MKILMFFHSGSKNRGCEAIVRTAAGLLKKEGEDDFITLASYQPETDQHIPCVDALVEDKRLAIPKYSMDWFQVAYHQKIHKDENYAYQKIYAPLISMIPQHDIFLSIGGDNYCYGEQPGIYEIDKQIKKANKKLVLWGASIGEEDLSESKLADLATFDLILARESLTYETLKKHGLEKVKLVADGAFLLEAEALPLPSGWKEDKTIGFNFSPLVAKKNEQAEAAALQLLQYIIDHTDFQICLTPHVIEEGNDDHALLTKYFERFKNTGRVLLLPNNLNAIQYKGYIARMRMFIGARTHATIAAYSSLVPTLVLGYSVKSRGIAKDIFGEEKLVLHLHELLDPQKLQEKFEELLREEGAIRSILQQRIPEVKKMAMKAADYLKELR